MSEVTKGKKVIDKCHTKLFREAIMQMNDLSLSK